MTMRPEISPVTPQVADFFERMTYLPLAGITQMVPPGGAGIGMHVIPVEQAIPANCESLPVEHLSHWLKKYEGHIGVGICSCRKQQRIRGEGSGDIEQYWCIGVGDFADYCRETGMGHDITYDEAMEILHKAEERGYVHQITNIDGENKIFGLCNCAVGVCNALRTSQLFNTPNMSRSAYTAQVTPENCVACGKCVEVCPAGAVRLGQKLCTSHGEVEYPKQPLPDNNVWGEDKWNWNYKNENGVIQTWPTGTAPCKAACPLHIGIQGYIKLAGEGKYREALELIKKDNPFPAVCGAICRKYCEDECTRGTVDEALAIDDIKQFIAAQDLKAEHRYVPPMNSSTREKFDQKIAIIGSGPAGLSCAYFLAIEGYSPVVFEKDAVPGGMMVTGIPNFRLEKDVVNAEIDVLREMGVEFRCGVEVGKDVTIQQLRDQGFRGFFVAVGLQYGGKLNVPGDDAVNVMPGVDYIKSVNAGKAQPLSGNVVVIGGGNIGADVARTAIRQGAESVQLYCLEQYEDMPMGEEDQELCRADGVTIHAGWGQTAIDTEDGRATGIHFRRCLSVKNAEGRFDPQFDDNDTAFESCTTVLYCIGQKVEWKELLKDTKVEFRPNGIAIADPVTLQTAEPDIFVGGDVYTGQKFVVDALAAGREGAVSLHRFVNEGQSLTIHRNTRHFASLNKDDIVLPDEAKNKPRRAVKGVDAAKADPVTLQTAEPDIFAGGDAVSGQKFVVDALAMGREGAVSLHRFVNEGQSLTIHRNTRHFTPLNKDEIVLPVESYKKPARAVKGVDKAKVRTMNDERLIFTEEQIKSEASRCLSCGRSVVDTNKCLGCGMCTVQCKFDAIHLTRSMGDAYSKMIPAEDKFKAIGAYAAKRGVKIVRRKAAGKAAK